MEADFDLIMRQIYLFFLKMGTPISLLAFSYASLKSIIGDKDAVPTALRQIAVGLLGLIIAPTIIYFITKIAAGFNIDVSIIDQ